MSRALPRSKSADLRNRRHWRRFVAVLALPLVMAGCQDRDAVRVQLGARIEHSERPHRLRVEAQVAGDLAGLRYKWFSISGECDPQESVTPMTTFLFGHGVNKDRLAVEVWRNDQRVGRAELDVTLDKVVAQTDLPNVQIEITTIPPYELGGPDTRADIAGRVKGELEPGCSVLVYARAYDSWHIQPLAHAQHPISADNAWNTWTHTGVSYAALLVRPGYTPMVRLDLLPPLGGYVIARAIVDGARE